MVTCYGAADKTLYLTPSEAAARHGFKLPHPRGFTLTHYQGFKCSIKKGGGLTRENDKCRVR